MGEDMTYHVRERIFTGMGAAVLVGALSLSACATSPVEDVAAASGRSGQPVDTGSYPNLNIPPQVATEQFSESERDAKLAQLSALQHRGGPGSTTTDGSNTRKRLQVSQDAQEETLRIIEGQ